MAVVQSTWNAAPAIGFPGMVANGETGNRFSRNVEDAAGIGFGVAVFQGATDRGCTKTVGSAATFLGITIVDHGEVVLPGGPAADMVEQNRAIGIMSAGAIYVTTTTATTPRAPVYLVAATGLFTATATSNIATGWQFDDTAAPGGICRIVKR